MIAGGEGGMVTTEDEALWARMWTYKNHGNSWDAAYRRQLPPGFRWLHESFGTNWCMLEMQAAIGRVQRRRVDAWMATRRAHARRLREALPPFAGRGLRLPLSLESGERGDIHAH